uniref:Uncharacterized protein n=1 Tax=Wuchereria bancrofti TaxID=6293 RepID=A0A1I8EWY1_WUCBA
MIGIAGKSKITCLKNYESVSAFYGFHRCKLCKRKENDPPEILEKTKCFHVRPNFDVITKSERCSRICKRYDIKDEHERKEGDPITPNFAFVMESIIKPMIPSSLLTRPIYGFFPIHKIRLGK